MLVLTRRIHESILLGDDIRITVLEINGDRIRLGVEAPQSMRILRAELLAEASAFNREANQTSLAFFQEALQKGETSASDSVSDCAPAVVEET
ncbi:MAG: carbon storage regulator CsrA [Clostridiaceae bacterium]|nr:carbon storage regulator CsrA [Clostridiaceae bacterium]